MDLYHTSRTMNHESIMAGQQVLYTQDEEVKNGAQPELHVEAKGKLLV